MKHVSGLSRSPREANPDVPEEIGAVTKRLLAKDPEERYPDAAVLLKDLERVKEGLPPAASTTRGSGGRVSGTLWSGFAASSRWGRARPRPRRRLESPDFQGADHTGGGEGGAEAQPGLVATTNRPLEVARCRQVARWKRGLGPRLLPRCGGTPAGIACPTESEGVVLVGDDGRVEPLVDLPITPAACVLGGPLLLREFLLERNRKLSEVRARSRGSGFSIGLGRTGAGALYTARSRRAMPLSRCRAQVFADGTRYGRAG